MTVVEDALTGIEIVDAWLEAMPAGWMHPFDDRRLNPQTRVWVDLFKDMDYQWAALLTVVTATDAVQGERSPTIVDHLAVWEHPKGRSIEWHNNPRLFFDQDRWWAEDGETWFVGWLGQEMADRNRWDEEERDPKAVELTRDHNIAVRRGDRQAARAAGVTLPYLEFHDRPCGHCKELIHLADGIDWLDDDDSDECLGREEGHEPK